MIEDLLIDKPERMLMGTRVRRVTQEHGPLRLVGIQGPEDKSVVIVHESGRSRDGQWQPNKYHIFAVVDEITDPENGTIQIRGEHIAQFDCLTKWWRPGDR